jgi:hypothetical protein
MKRRIFVGSSTEALDKAQQVCDILASVPDTECVLWTEIFNPGYLTFEALETMLRTCCAATFVATPDDATTIRGLAAKSPRANVMLEFGLVAGRLGRRSVALCQYDGAQLPSDLQGMTVIDMNQADADGSGPMKDGATRLKIWGSRLLATANSIPRTEVVHGYTGRWEFDLRLDRWRDLPVVSPSYVEVKGDFELFLPASGDVGRGLAHGRR